MGVAGRVGYRPSSHARLFPAKGVTSGKKSYIYIVCQKQKKRKKERLSCSHLPPLDLTNTRCLLTRNAKREARSGITRERWAYWQPPIFCEIWYSLGGRRILFEANGIRFQMRVCKLHTLNGGATARYLSEAVSSLKAEYRDQFRPASGMFREKPK